MTKKAYKLRQINIIIFSGDHKKGPQKNYRKKFAFLRKLYAKFKWATKNDP